jgi:hypothetical protein
MKIFSSKFSLKLINTPIYNSVPILKLHSIAVLQNNNNLEKLNNENNDVFLIDFSPVEDISSPNVIFKLLQGKKIPGKIRVFCISKSLLKDTITKDNCLQNTKFIDNLDPKLNNENIKKLEKIDSYLVNIINSWGSSFQVYNRNCRHFTNYLKKNYSKKTIIIKV